MAIKNNSAYVDNICRWYHRGNEDDEHWYEYAKLWTSFISKESAFTIHERVIAGIASALSPGVSWERSQFETHMLVQLVTAGVPIDNSLFSTYGKQVRKAIKIAKLVDPHDATNIDMVINDILSPKAYGMKTLSFYAAIADPWRRDVVVLDRHAVRVANWPDPVHTPAQYARLAAIYHLAAGRLNKTMNQVQARTWCAYRRTK